MSVAALSWVLEHSDARLADRLVLLSLADHAKSDGTCSWPSIDTIARHARISRRQAQYSLASLEESGAIVRTGVSRAGTTIWTVAMAIQIAFDPAEDGGADTARADSAPVQNPTNGGAEVAPDPSENRPITPPVAPPQGGAPSGATSLGGKRSRRRRRDDPRATLQTHLGKYDPDAIVDPWTRQVYANLGVELPDGATHADAERACAEWTPTEDAA